MLEWLRKKLNQRHLKIKTYERRQKELDLLRLTEKYPNDEFLREKYVQLCAQNRELRIWEDV